MSEQPNNSTRIGTVPIDGGEVRFTYDDVGNVTGTFEDLTYRDAWFETHLIDGWRDVISAAAAGASGDAHVQQVATDDVAASARIADVHLRAAAALEAAGKGDSPEVRHLHRSAADRFAAIEERYGHVLRRHDDAVYLPPNPAKPAAPAPVGFEDTPRTYAADGTAVGFDLSRGYVAPAGFVVRFTYAPGGAVASFAAEAGVGMDTVVRDLLQPGWETSFEAHVEKVAHRSPLRKLLAWFRHEAVPTRETLRRELGARLKELLTGIYVRRQALLGLERANLGKSPEAAFVRDEIAKATAESCSLADGKDIFR